MSNTEQFSKLISLQIIKQNRLLRAFNGLGESADLKEFLDL